MNLRICMVSLILKLLNEPTIAVQIIILSYISYSKYRQNNKYKLMKSNKHTFTIYVVLSCKSTCRER